MRRPPQDEADVPSRARIVGEDARTSSVESYEVLIVGGGKAGKTLAADLARSGHRLSRHP